MHADHEMLSKYPPVVCLTGNQDPLSDDCFRMVEKLKYLIVNLAKPRKETLG